MIALLMQLALCLVQPFRCLGDGGLWVTNALQGLFHGVRRARLQPGAKSARQRGRRLTIELRRIGATLGLSAAQLALAWVLNRPGLVAIPKAARTAHVAQNLRATELGLTPAIMAELDALFPAPRAPRPLEMI